MTRQITTVFSELYASEINAGLSSFWDDGFIVWLGDGINGVKVERSFQCADECMPGAFSDWNKLWSEAADWLHHEALSYYPNSRYAKAARGVQHLS